MLVFNLSSVVKRAYFHARTTEQLYCCPSIGGPSFSCEKECCGNEFQPRAFPLLYRTTCPQGNRQNLNVVMALWAIECLPPREREISRRTEDIVAFAPIATTSAPPSIVVTRSSTTSRRVPGYDVMPSPTIMKRLSEGNNETQTVRRRLRPLPSA